MRLNGGLVIIILKVEIVLFGLRSFGECRVFFWMILKFLIFGFFRLMLVLLYFWCRCELMLVVDFYVYFDFWFL